LKDSKYTDHKHKQEYTEVTAGDQAFITKDAEENNVLPGVTVLRKLSNIQQSNEGKHSQRIKNVY
jgi:S-adenosylmethionine:tRNA-ribosyltransferase-isomerase (queuine synthetase)